MASSYYPVTTDSYFDHTQSQSKSSTSHYSSYQTNKNKKNDSDDDDDDLDALRKAALKTLNSKKRKNNYEHSPIHRHSRSPSPSSSTSRSSYTRSSISRSYSSSSLSSISSNSLDKNDKDYRFENKEKPITADIDERFPHDNDDMLIVNCPIQDDDLLVQNERKKSFDHDERKIQKSNSKEIKHRQKSPSIEQPISITVKLNSDEFDLRQLIKKRRKDESSSTNHRVVQILPKDNQSIVHKTIHDRLSSKRSDKNHKH